MRFILVTVLFVLMATVTVGAPPSPENFVFCNLDRQIIYEKWFENTTEFAGAQIKYRWKDLEPVKGSYDFSKIMADWAWLVSLGKKLAIQIQDASFDDSVINVPSYIMDGQEYGGGVDRQYYFADDNDNNPQKAGWVARRWDPHVAERFHRLIKELGQKFDGKIAIVTLPETSVDFGSTGRFHPKGFSPDTYRKAILANMEEAKQAFSHTVVIQYANFMPGEWLPWDDKGYLRSVFSEAAELGIGVGGPDVIPYQKGQMNHSYALAREYKGKVRLGYAVQEGNYTQKNVNTGKPMTINDIYIFAKDYLHVDYLFWYPEEPYFKREVIPYLLKVASPKP